MSTVPSFRKVVTGFKITSGGADYTAPTITITGGEGDGATAEATVTNGVITAITLTNKGYGFASPPTVTVTDDSGSGAIIEAYIGEPDYKNKLEFLIQEQLPEFIQNEYAGFVTFLEGYYRFLDQSGQVNDVLLNAAKFSDIDQTLNEFIEEFRKQYAVDIPRSVLVNQRRLIKLIREFYDTKGSEKSIELLFKILYDETVEFFYPSEHILRASDGIWIQDVVLRIIGADANNDPFDLAGKICEIVYYENTGTQIFPKTIETAVTEVKKIAYTSPAIYELKVSLPKNSPLKVPGAGAVAEATIVDGQITEIEVISGGSGYYAAPVVLPYGTEGTGAVLRANIANGMVDSITVIQGGSGYESPLQIVFPTDTVRTSIRQKSNPSETFGYVIRQLSTVEVVSCDGEGVDGDCGFRVGQIYQIDETSQVGPYVIYPPLGTPSNTLLTAIGDAPADYGTYDEELFDLNRNNPYFDATGNYNFIGRDNRASVKITSVGEDGCVLGASIFNVGYGFQQEQFEATITSPTGCEAVLSFTTGAILARTGRFKDSRGMLSNVNKLQDNYYYQNYSYVIRSGIPAGNWMNTLKKSAHPAGMAVFGELIISQNLELSDFIGVVQIEQLHEFFVDVFELNDQHIEFEFFKVLEDQINVASPAYYAVPDYAGTTYAYDFGSDTTVVDFHKVLFDTVTTSEYQQFDYDIGIYDYEADTTSTIDLFDRVVQFYRDFGETLQLAEEAVVAFDKTVVEDPVWVTRDFYASANFAGVEWAYDYGESVSIGFNKILADGFTKSDQLNTIDIGKVLSDAISTSETKGFVINKVLSDAVSALDAPAKQTSFAVSDNVSSITDDSIVSSLLNKTELATTLDYYNKILQISRDDSAETSEIILIEDKPETIDLVGINETSRVIINKGIGDLLGISDSGIINMQDYVDGDFGSDYVGLATYF